MHLQYILSIKIENANPSFLFFFSNFIILPSVPLSFSYFNKCFLFSALLQLRLTQIGCQLKSIQKYNMLGIESEISMQTEISRLSISSNTSKLAKKNQLSSPVASTMNSDGLMSANSSNNSKIQKIKQLRNKMSQIYKNQADMKQRMEYLVGMIQKELRKKDDQINELQQLIEIYKRQIEQKSNHLQLMSNYINTIMNSAQETPKTTKNNNANVRNLGESIGVPTKRIEINIGKHQKSVSPKGKTNIQDVSIKPNKYSIEEKKPLQQSNAIGSNYRKLRSPGK